MLLNVPDSPTDGIAIVLGFVDIHRIPQHDNLRNHSKKKSAGKVGALYSRTRQAAMLYLEDVNLP